MVCEPVPVCIVPLLHGPEMTVPFCVCAEAAKGELLGNVLAPGINVAVCANPSLFTKRIAEPTATDVTAGA